MVDQVDAATVIENFVYDENNQERRPWKFCNSTSLPRSEVVFFSQVIIIFVILALCFFKLFLFDLTCEETTIWVAILTSTVGYILPNPKL